MIDLKIELTKLFALHKASITLDHAVRESATPNLDWRLFRPSKFIYSYFAFNSIYSFDWEKSIELYSPMRWGSTEDENHPKEEDQIKAIVKFSCQSLGSQAPLQFIRILKGQLQNYKITKPIEALRDIRPSNESKRVKGLRNAFPGNFKTLFQSPDLTQDSLLSSLSGSLSYIQSVRNNVFHGSKTSIQMDDRRQQERLLIYAALVNSLCELFFCAIASVLPGWNCVPADFAKELEVAS
ncbi:MAG: hypothetical protein CEE38_21955 [Planctomycetes bacterium B3_Pla]|nr:MAG: hypothetical protein CEE38_21955 [Planctomycetes bacterium B3_Pla]